MNRIYHEADIRAAFPELGSPVIRTWLNKGWLSHGDEFKGTARMVITYSFGEVLHAGVLSKMSQYGVTRGVNTRVWLDSPEIPPLSRFVGMDEPQAIIAHYEALAMNFAVVIRGRFEPKKRLPGERLHTAQWHFDITICPYSERSTSETYALGADSYFKHWHRPAGGAYDPAICFVSGPALTFRMKLAGITV